MMFWPTTSSDDVTVSALNTEWVTIGQQVRKLEGVLLGSRVNVGCMFVRQPERKDRETGLVAR